MVATWVVVATPAVVARAGAVEDKPAVEPPPEEGCAAASASTPSILMDGGLPGLWFVMLVWRARNRSASDLNATPYMQPLGQHSLVQARMRQLPRTVVPQLEQKLGVNLP